ncbi:MAG: hypothetical protein WCP97_05165 [bacterium]
MPKSREWQIFSPRRLPENWKEGFTLSRDLCDLASGTDVQSVAGSLARVKTSRLGDQSCVDKEVPSQTLVRLAWMALSQGLYGDSRKLVDVITRRSADRFNGDALKDGQWQQSLEMPWIQDVTSKGEYAVCRLLRAAAMTDTVKFEDAGAFLRGGKQLYEEWYKQKDIQGRIDKSEKGSEVLDAEEIKVVLAYGNVLNSVLQWTLRAEASAQDRSRHKLLALQYLGLVENVAGFSMEQQLDIANQQNTLARIFLVENNTGAAIAHAEKSLSRLNLVALQPKYDSDYHRDASAEAYLIIGIAGAGNDKIEAITFLNEQYPGQRVLPQDIESLIRAFPDQVMAVINSQQPLQSDNQNFSRRAKAICSEVIDERKVRNTKRVERWSFYAWAVLMFQGIYVRRAIHARMDQRKQVFPEFLDRVSDPSEIASATADLQKELIVNYSRHAISSMVSEVFHHEEEGILNSQFLHALGLGNAFEDPAMHQLVADRIGLNLAMLHGDAKEKFDYARKMAEGFKRSGLTPHEQLQLDHAKHWLPRFSTSKSKELQLEDVIVDYLSDRMRGADFFSFRSELQRHRKNFILYTILSDPNPLKRIDGMANFSKGHFDLPDDFWFKMQKVVMVGFGLIIKHRWSNVPRATGMYRPAFSENPSEFFGEYTSKFLRNLLKGTLEQVLEVSMIQQRTLGVGADLEKTNERLGTVVGAKEIDVIEKIHTTLVNTEQMRKSGNLTAKQEREILLAIVRFVIKDTKYLGEYLRNKYREIVDPWFKILSIMPNFFSETLSTIFGLQSEMEKTDEQMTPDEVVFAQVKAVLSVLNGEGVLQYLDPFNKGATYNSTNTYEITQTGVVKVQDATIMVTNLSGKAERISFREVSVDGMTVDDELLARKLKNFCMPARELGWKTGDEEERDGRAVDKFDPQVESYHLLSVKGVHFSENITSKQDILRSKISFIAEKNVVEQSLIELSGSARLTDAENITRYIGNCRSSFLVLWDFYEEHKAKKSHEIPFNQWVEMQQKPMAGVPGLYFIQDDRIPCKGDETFHKDDGVPYEIDRSILPGALFNNYSIVVLGMNQTSKRIRTKLIVDHGYSNGEAAKRILDAINKRVIENLRNKVRMLFLDDVVGSEFIGLEGRSSEVIQLPFSEKRLFELAGTTSTAQALSYLIALGEKKVNWAVRCATPSTKENPLGAENPISSLTFTPVESLVGVFAKSSIRATKKSAIGGKMHLDDLRKYVYQIITCPPNLALAHAISALTYLFTGRVIGDLTAVGGVQLSVMYSSDGIVAFDPACLPGHKDACALLTSRQKLDPDSDALLTVAVGGGTRSQREYFAKKLRVNLALLEAQEKQNR